MKSFYIKPPGKAKKRYLVVRCLTTPLSETYKVITPDKVLLFTSNVPSVRLHTCTDKLIKWCVQGELTDEDERIVMIEALEKAIRENDPAFGAVEERLADAASTHKVPGL